MAFEAATWRQEQAQRRDLVIAWHVAALGRAKRMPNLRELLNPGKTKELTSEEQKQRQTEFEELTARMGKRG